MSKNQKKKRRGQDAVDEAFAEAEAGLDAKARRQQHSAMLEALFEIFFRVLKHCAAASRQQGKPLLHCLLWQCCLHGHLSGYLLQNQHSRCQEHY